MALPFAPSQREGFQRSPDTAAPPPGLTRYGGVPARQADSALDPFRLAHEHNR
jgi:hypothetical protein